MHYLGKCVSLRYSQLLRMLTIDTVKTRYQTQYMSTLEEIKPLVGGERRYISTWHCMKDTFRQEGLSGIYRGMGITMVRAFIGILS